MKTKNGLIMIWAVFIIVSFFNPIKTSAQGEAVSFQAFYDNLSPYGQWVERQGVGYIWIPDVAPGFAPYATNGYWASTEMGWTWVSNYEWGWAAFHYGRWDRDPNIGWFWVPGYTWAPAWVAWRQSPGYFGWPPLRPGIEIDAVTGGIYNPEPAFWVFAHERYMGDPYISNYYAPLESNTAIIYRSSFIHETYIGDGATYIYGPSTEVVERSVGRPVERVVIVERSSPGYTMSGHELSIYRPHVERREGLRPTRVEEMRNIRPERERQENYARMHPESVRHEEHREAVHQEEHREAVHQEEHREAVHQEEHREAVHQEEHREAAHQEHRPDAPARDDRHLSTAPNHTVQTQQQRNTTQQSQQRAQPNQQRTQTQQIGQRTQPQQNQQRSTTRQRTQQQNFKKPLPKKVAPVQNQKNRGK